jgi:predicted porin
VRQLLVPALALLASSLAHAQSNVTIYGRVDLGLTKQNDGTTSLNGGNGATGSAGDRWDLRQGSAGRIGFRGTEDLGGGLSAGFLFEHRFTPDNGAAATPFWQARSYVELISKTAGGIYLGREYIPAFWPALRLDPFAFDTVGTLGPKHQFAQYTIDGGIRSNNTLGYKTPKLGGFTANLAYSFGEQARPSSRGANMEYTAGALYLGAAFDRLDGDNHMSLVGGAYDFTVVRPAVTYVSAKVAGVKHTNLSIAATAPLAAGRLKVAIGRLDPEGDDNNTTKIGLGYEYPLSKRTSIYSDIGSADQQGSSGGVERTRTTAFDVGIKHNF